MQHSVVACGYWHTAALDGEGNVWTTGNNTYGQLGYGDHRREPERIPELINITSIACGRYYTMCLDYNGHVWGFGANGYGQLGLGHTDIRKKPEKIPNLPEIISIACGFAHTICIDSGSRAWGFGWNESSQLGIASRGDVVTPTLIPKLSQVQRASCGKNHTLFLDNEGKVFVLGDNEKGKLGVPPETSIIPVPQMHPTLTEIVSVSCGVHHSAVLDEYGEVYVMGDSKATRMTESPHKLENLPYIRTIACGYYHTMMIDDNGHVWGFGDNRSKQVGKEDMVEFSKATEILFGVYPNRKSIGASFISQGGETTIVKEDGGDIYVFGNNYKGQLGLNSGNEFVSPTPLDGSLSTIIGERIHRTKSARK